MAWAFFGVVTGYGFSPEVLGLNIRDFWDCFRTVQTKIRDCLCENHVNKCLFGVLT